MVILVYLVEVTMLPDKLSHTAFATEKPVILALIPAYNEERFIASVVLETKKYATHVIVVDDGSSDRTAELALAAGAQVVGQPKNMGKAQALNAGFRAARLLNPDVVVCLDGDAQHDPVDIPQVIRPILEGQADVVIGSRFLGRKSKIPGWRIVGQHTLTLVTNLASGIKTTDSQSGFRAFSPLALKALRFHTAGLSVESEMQFTIQQAGLRVAEVPISVSYMDGNKRNPVVQALQILDAILSLVARRRPLLFFGFPGLLCAGLGILVGLRVVQTVAAGGEVPLGSAVLADLLLVGGMILGLAGVMLHSIHHFVTQVRREVRDVVEISLRGDSRETGQARPLETQEIPPAKKEQLA